MEDAFEMELLFPFFMGKNKAVGALTYVWGKIFKKGNTSLHMRLGGGTTGLVIRYSLFSQP